MSRQETSIADEWDCIVDFLRNGEPALSKDAICSMIEKWGRSYSWAEKWTVPRAGLLGAKQPAILESLTEKLRQAAVHQFGVTDSELADFRSQFFQQCFQLGERAFDFIGREEELADIHKHLSLGSRQLCITSQSLTGFGGQGKTAVALEYARRYRDQYSAILMVDARNMNLLAQISAFAHEQNKELKPYEGGPSEKRLAYYLEEIAASFRGNILLIIDDVPSSPEVKTGRNKAEGQLEKFIKAIPDVLIGRYRLLITSRRELLPNTLKKYMIEKMNHNDAIALFISRADWPTQDKTDSRVSELVNNLLGGHALSIALLGAYSREHDARDLDRLISMVQTRLVEAEALKSVSLEEYPLSLQASFMISFDAISQDARYLLLALSMFRRSTIAVQCIRQCANDMSPQTSQIQDFKKRLTKRGPTKLFQDLHKHSLIERVHASDQKNKEQLVQVQLHEVIYDFSQSQWVKLWEDDHYHDPLKDLEISLTQSACNYASLAINSQSIQFQDMETLTGLLIPIARPDRGYLPSRDRTVAALGFWFHHFKFQNFVYDTGIQELLLDQLLQLENYLQNRHELTRMFSLILFKLIGHAYYADPKETGDIAKAYFSKALEQARLMLQAPDAGEHEATIRWYIIFLLDHRSNVEAKRRPIERQVIPIRHDPAFERDFDEIEQTLTEPLKTLSAPPTKAQCELLLRAAHYWGHRGNQDSYSLYQKYLTGEFDNTWKELVCSSAEHYQSALNYRLLGLRVFMPGRFNSALAKLYHNQKLPFAVPWLEQADTLREQTDYEGFTSVSQGIGDTAHQYRGLHFVFVLEYLAERMDGNSGDHQKVQVAFDAARALWGIASKNLRGGEVLLKYYLWMSSSEILMDWVTKLENGHALPTLESSLETLEKETKRLQETMKSGYGHSVSEQSDQLTAIWGAMGRLRLCDVAD